MKRALQALVLLVVLASALACDPANSPPTGPESTCTAACAEIDQHCTPAECTRGCNLILDRLVEQQGETILTCVEMAKGHCDDRVWASCAARVGPHADGGPPPPPPPDDE
jgi:hypothetical protein